MPYNLIIANQESQWLRNPSPFPISRLFEYTDDYIKKKYVNQNGINFKEISDLPALLVNEFACDIPAKVARINRLHPEGDTVFIDFEEIEEIPGLPIQQIEDMAFELGLGPWEGNRTHWAIKDIDLLATLNRHRLLPPVFIWRDKDGSKAEAFLSSITPEELVARTDRTDKKSGKKSIFVSYCHADSDVMDRLRVHLKPLASWMELEIWDDSRIEPGKHWRDEIQSAIDNASAAVLVMSADFLASDFISQKEVPHLLSAAQGRGVRIIPLISKPCLFTSHPELKDFQAVNNPSQPLISLSEAGAEAVFVQLASTIQGIVTK